MDDPMLRPNVVTAVNQVHWQQELKLHDELLTKLALRLPPQVLSRYRQLHDSLKSA